MINRKKIVLAGFLQIIVFITGSFAQELTLKECHREARENYPLTQQMDLIEKKGSLTLENIEKRKLPNINIAGQLTYQTDVTTIPISLPNFDIPTLNHDQYHVYTEITQPITELFTNHLQEKLQMNKMAIEKGRLESQLYTIKSSINELYFGILLTDEKIIQAKLTHKDILTAIETVNTAVENGTAYKINLDRLRASQLEIEQQLIEFREQRTSYLAMLAQLTGKDLPDTTQLQKPIMITPEKNINRPEMNVFNLQKENSSLRSNILHTTTIPQISLFLQSGIGRPSPVNLLKNEWSPYFLGGLRIQWNIGNYYTRNNDHQLLNIDSQNIRVQQESFVFNTKLKAKKYKHEIKKLKALISSDSQTIQLRTSIKNTAKHQLENGVITSNDYLKEVYAEDKARQNKSLHKIQLLMNQYLLQTSMGD